MRFTALILFLALALLPTRTEAERYRVRVQDSSPEPSFLHVNAQSTAYRWAKPMVVVSDDEITPGVRTLIVEFPDGHPCWLVSAVEFAKDPESKVWKGQVLPSANKIEVGTSCAGVTWEPVPEAPSAVSLGVGLGLLGALFRRRHGSITPR